MAGCGHRPGLNDFLGCSQQLVCITVGCGNYLIGKMAGVLTWLGLRRQDLDMTSFTWRQDVDRTWFAWRKFEHVHRFWVCLHIMTERYEYNLACLTAGYVHDSVLHDGRLWTWPGMHDGRRWSCPEFHNGKMWAWPDFHDGTMWTLPGFGWRRMSTWLLCMTAGCGHNLVLHAGTKWTWPVCMTAGRGHDLVWGADLASVGSPSPGLWNPEGEKKSPVSKTYSVLVETEVEILSRHLQSKSTCDFTLITPNKKYIIVRGTPTLSR